MVLMIIKGLCGRYERWNPVHPTTGAFWGMGIGIGCGVGWGPGFGPEVVGYVGAGCGIGFSVGITLAGIGIGLPANYVFEVPYNVLVATKSGALEIARSSCLLAARNAAGNDLGNFGVCISQIQSKAITRLSRFQHEVQLGKIVDLSDMKRAITSQTMSTLDHVQRFGSHIFRPHKGLKD